MSPVDHVASYSIIPLPLSHPSVPSPLPPKTSPGLQCGCSGCGSYSYCNLCHSCLLSLHIFFSSNVFFCVYCMSAEVYLMTGRLGYAGRNCTDASWSRCYGKGSNDKVYESQDIVERCLLTRRVALRERKRT